MAYQHILLAADLIGRENHVIPDKALELSKATGAKLSIVHVVEYPYTYGMPYESPVMADWQFELENNAKEGFVNLADYLGIPPERQHMLTGQAKHEILDTAKKIGADLIIVGSHGRHGIGLVLLGSTATAILHGAKCDVLAVRVNDATA